MNNNLLKKLLLLHSIKVLKKV